MTESIGQRARVGVAWALGAQVIMRGLTTVRLVVLANFLAPGDFGLFGVAMLALSALEQLSRFGFNAALIQKADANRTDVDTVWSVQLVRSTLLAALLFVGAPWLARFFAEPAAASLIRVVAVGQFINGWKSIGVVLYQKELQFRQKALLDLVGEATVLAVSFALVLWLSNVWALVWGYVGGVILAVAVSWVAHPFRPRFRIDRDSLQAMSHISKHTYYQNVLAFLFTDADDWFVGKVLGATPLGLYQMAYRLSNLVATEFTSVISTVTMPSYARMQHDRELLMHSFRRVFEAVSYTVIPMGFAIGLFARDGVLLLLGEEWLPMVPALQLLSAFGVLRALGATFSPVYLTLRRANLATRANLLQLAIMVVTIYPLGLRYGITGVGMAVTVAIVCGYIFNVIQFTRLTGIAAGRLLAPAAGTTLVCLLVAAEVQLLSGLAVLQPDSVLVRLGLSVAAAALLFALQGWVLTRWAGINLRVLLWGHNGGSH